MTATFQYFPFNDQDMYQQQWTDMFTFMRTTGVVTPNLTLNASTNDLAITAPGGLQVAAAIGNAFIEGTFFIQTDDYAYIPIAANNDPSGYDRIDLVTLQTDWTAMITSYFVIEGTPSASPIVPTPTQVQNLLWQMPLAQVYVTNGTMDIVTGNITDERPKSFQDGGAVTLLSDGTGGAVSLVAYAGPSDPSTPLAIYGLIGADNVTVSAAMSGNVTISGASNFLSTSQTGTGSPQTIAHGLGDTPFNVLIVPIDTTSVSGTYTTSYTANSTDVIVTATSGLVYVVSAWAS